jgi:sterol desaturase/sphingolipid hydroxylase (fatty acid hydroxylase superfamily)
MEWLKALENGQQASEWYLFAGALLVLGLWEVLLPKRLTRSERPVRMGTHGVLFALTLVTSSLVPLSGMALAVGVEKSSWGSGIAAFAPWGLRFVVGILAIDLARYAAHYAFHSVSLLWRIHSVHHSDVDFDLTTGVRHHPIEVLLIAAVELGTIALFAVPAAAVFALGCVAIVHSLFSHANVVLPRRLEAVLRLAIITPEFHEIHHSIQEREQRSNLGNVFPWWDRLFGTAVECSQLGTGLRFGLDEGQTEPELNVPRLLVEPFVMRGASRVGGGDGEGVELVETGVGFGKKREG